MINDHTISPCYNCQDRHFVYQGDKCTTCHDTCSKYIEYKQNTDTKKEKINKRKKFENDFTAYEITNSRKRN